MQFHDIEQNTPAWLALRVGKVTGSNFGCFMANDGKAFGEPAKKYALQIALEQVTGKKSGVAGFSNAHTERGHEQEPVARELYENENFVDVTNGGFFDWGLYGDSPDGLVGSEGVIEIKSVIATTHFDTLRRDDFDPSYKWQLMGHLDCTGFEWVDFVSYCADFPEPKQLITHRLYRDDYSDELERLRARRSEFLELISQYKALIEA